MPDRIEVPEEIAAHLPGFHWEVRLVWRLDAPVVALPLARFARWLELPFWSSGPGMLFDLTPSAVLADPDRVPHQWERVLRADLSHPIDLFEDQDGSIKLLDGLHRICRATLESRDHIDARIHPHTCAPLVRVTRDDPHTR